MKACHSLITMSCPFCLLFKYSRYDHSASDPLLYSSISPLPLFSFLTSLDYTVPKILYTFVFLSHLFDKNLTDKLNCLISQCFQPRAKHWVAEESHIEGRYEVSLRWAGNMTWQFYHIYLIQSVSHSSQVLFHSLLFIILNSPLSLILSDDHASYFTKKTKDIRQEPFNFFLSNIHISCILT